MKSSISVFPKKLTAFSLFFLIIVVGFGLFSLWKTSSLLTSFQANDIPALQLSCAATRVMSETEQLLLREIKSRDQISFQSMVVDDSLKEILVLTKQYPQLGEKFSQSPGYLSFQRSLNNPGADESIKPDQFKNLKEEVQTLLEEYLLIKNEAIQKQVFFGYLSGGIIILGLVLFLFLLYAIYFRYQKNLESLELLTQNLEKERLATIQSSKLASLGEMAAGLAHEINNPLAVIVGRVEIILEKINNGSASDLEVTKTISKINEMAFRISKIVHSMRKISKGSNKDEIIPVNMIVVVEDLLNLCSERLRNSQITLDYSQVQPDIMVMANYTYLSQVLINLLNNGIDELLKQSEENRKIWLETQVEDSTVLIRVRDSGKGIPADVRSKLFLPFFTTKEIGKGTGLGLSISKTLMNDMNGDLELSPDLNQTTFILKLRKC